MMRLSSSVRLTWSVGPGPSLPGVGSRPPGFLPVAAALASRAAILASYSAGSRACRSFARASMIARARPAALPPLRPRLDDPPRPDDLGQAQLAPGQFVWDRHPVRHIRLIRRLRLGHQLRNFSLQLGFDLARMLIRQRAVAAGVGVDLGAIERDRAQLQHAHLTGELQYLDEQGLDLLKEAPPEGCDGIVVRVLVGRDEAERHRIITRPLQLAAGEHAGGVAVDQDAQQHTRV